MMGQREVHEVILWMDDCKPERLTPNTVMLCTRNMFILENMRDFIYDEFVDIIKKKRERGDC